MEVTPLMTVQQLAKFLAVERKTIYRLDIPYSVVGSHRRYRMEDVNAYLESRKVVKV